MTVMGGFGYHVYVTSASDWNRHASVAAACALTSRIAAYGSSGQYSKKRRGDFVPWEESLDMVRPLLLHRQHQCRGCHSRGGLVAFGVNEICVAGYSTPLAAKPPSQSQENKQAPLIERSVEVSVVGSMNGYLGYQSSSAKPQEGGADILSLCVKGQLDKALEALLCMDNERTVPSVYEYRSLLTLCSKQKALAHAKRVHAHLARYQLESTSYLGESVVNSLIKCGSLEDALPVFHRLRGRTVVSWTAIISAYTMSGQGQEALRMYHAMQEERVQPSKYTLLSLIKACSMIGDLQEGKRIHSEAINYRFDSDMFVGTCLVDMYVKCGSIVDAQAVFDTLVPRDVVSWTAMVAGYAKCGQGERALQLFQQMLEEGVKGNERTLVSLLQACSSLAEEEMVVSVGRYLLRVECLGKGKELHAEARRKGYEMNSFVISALVSMYAKCGNIEDAREVFDLMSQRDVVSWNTIIGAYVQQEMGEEALQFYNQMLCEGVSPDAYTFVSVLQACGILADEDIGVCTNGQSLGADILAKGKEIHAGALRTGHQSDVFVSNALISMYGRLRSILDAENVFEGLPSRNVVSWNAMLAAYVQQGQADDALQLYGRMVEEGWSPDDRTFVSVLQACSLLAEKTEDVLDRESIKPEPLQKGKALHAEVARTGYGTHLFVVNTLVYMYGKCGSVADVQNVFQGLSQHDVISWRLMLGACAQQGDPEEVLLMYGRMLEDGVSPDERTFVSLLQACGISAEEEEGVGIDGRLIKVECLQKGKAIHAEAHRIGYRLFSEVFLSSSLVSTYGRCGSIVDAQTVFDDMWEWDVVTWTTMLVAYSQEGEPGKALQLYSQMLEEGVSPDDKSFVGAIQACGMLADEEEAVIVDGLPIKVKAMDKGRAIHAEALKRGYQMHVFLGNTLVSMYGKCGSAEDARKVFDGLPRQTIVSWNAMVAAYVHQSQPDKALLLYQQMLVEGVSPDETTFMSILQACGDTGNLDICMHIHHSLVSNRDHFSLLLASTLIHTYGRCANMVEAHSVFDALPQPDVVSWNTLLAGYARQGNYDKLLQCFQEMLLQGMKPDGVTFVAILSACSHAGLVDKGLEYFESMTRDHGIAPEREHYASMVDLLGRAGYLTEVEAFLSKMPMQPTQSMCLCLLAACRKHCNVALGEYAFNMAVRLDPKQASAYVLMSNIYAHAGMWQQAKKVYDLKQEAGAWKLPGQSWIEKHQQVHMFVVGEHTREAEEDQTHELMQMLNLELQII